MFPATLTRNNGHIRRILIVALTALMLFATLAVAPGAPLGADRADAVVQDGDTCSANILFILDESGSMTYSNDAGAEAVRLAFKAFVAGMKSEAPDSNVGVVEFGNTAAPGFSGWWNVETKYDNLMTYIEDTYNPLSNNWTNWEAAFGAASSYSNVDYAILITDGNPTKWDTTPPSNHIAGTPKVGGGRDNNEAEFETGTYAAKFNADHVPAPDGRFIGYGVGQDFSADDVTAPKPHQNVYKSSDLDPGPFWDSSVARLGYVVDEVRPVADVGDLPKEIAELVDEICAPRIEIEKSTNGEDSDDAPGQEIRAGDPVTWTYTVENTGGVNLYGIGVTDDNGTTGTGDDFTPSCVATDLGVGASTTCTAPTGVAVPGPYANVATATGYTSTQEPVIDTDPSHYLGTLAPAHLTLVKEMSGDGIAKPTQWTLTAKDKDENVKVEGITGTPETTSVEVPAGSYTLSEKATFTGWENYDASSWSCEEVADQTPSQATADQMFELDGNVIELAPYADVVCTITNTYVPPPTHTITFVKRACDAYDLVRSNENAGNKQQNAEGIGHVIDLETGAIPVNSAWEDEYHESCSPVKDWPFTLGTELKTPGSVGGLGDTLSHAGGSMSVYYTGADGSVTIELSEPQLEQLSEKGGKLWISEGRINGDELVFDGASTDRNGSETDWGFAALRCGTDALNGDNAEAVVSADFNDDYDYAATCYAYNIIPEPASLTIVKETTGGNGTFKFASDELGNFSIKTTDHTGDKVWDDLGRGIYTVEETLPLGAYWSFVGASCEGQEGDAVLSEAVADDGGGIASVTVELAPGDDVTCTFKNKYTPPPPVPGKATLTIVKNTVGNDGTFSYLSGGSGLPNFDLVTEDGTDSKSFSLVAGTYTVAEDLGALTDGWAFDDLVCEGNGDATVIDESVSVVLDAGDNETCTFTNLYETPAPPTPGISIVKATSDSEGGPFRDGPTITADTSVYWQYVVTNTGGIALTGVVVTDDDPTVIVKCPQSTLAVGETMTCTAEGTAVVGSYANVGAVDTDEDVTDTDPSHYRGQGVLGTAQLGDTVWYDANNNGIQDNGEEGINGAKVILTDADGNVVDALSTSTGPWKGFYKFVGLEAGTYTATLDTQTVKSTYKLTTPASFTVTLAEGEEYLDADFGLYEEPKKEELPKTGSETEGVALFGLGMLLLGSLAVLSTRKRRGEQR